MPVPMATTAWRSGAGPGSSRRRTRAWVRTGVLAGSRLAPMARGRVAPSPAAKQASTAGRSVMPARSAPCQLRAMRAARTSARSPTPPPVGLSPELARMTGAVVAAAASVEHLGEGAGDGAEAEGVAGGPEGGGDLLGGGEGGGAVGGGDDGGGGGAGLVGPDVADHQVGLEDAGAGVEGGEGGVEGAGGLVLGGAALAGEKERDGGPGDAGARGAAEVGEEHVVCGLHGLADVDVRGGAVGGEDVDGVDDALAEVAVQVVAGGDGGVGADDLADGGDPVAFGVLHALDVHGAVHGEVDAVEGERGAEAVEELGLEGGVGGAATGPPGTARAWRRGRSATSGRGRKAK